MNDALECYTVRLPSGIKRMIKILAAQQGYTQQELLVKLVQQEEGKQKWKNHLKKYNMTKVFIVSSKNKK